MLNDPSVAIRLLQEIQKEREEKAALEIKNKALVDDVLEWKDGSVLNAIIRRLASRAFKDSFSKAWRLFFKELLYKHGISLELRKTKWVNEHPADAKKPTYKFLAQDEIGKAVASAVAICEEKDVDVSDILKKFAGTEIIVAD